jgi:hypothetical protein
MEGAMSELLEPVATLVEQSAADAAAQLTKTNRHAMDFMMGVQKVMLEEIMFASNEFFDRAKTETHLLSEFISKIAGSHSVKDLKAMCQDCGQHQIDFIRRDGDRLFKHGERMVEATAKLFKSES